MDTWGSAYVESTQAWFGKILLKELKKENKSRTHVWSPGQYEFELTNQKTIFELLRARNIEANVAAAMKRTAVPGTELYKYDEISSAELAKIVAVTELFVKPKRAMGVHEPDILSLMAGANQIYAEVNVNPRDVCLTTELSRGASMEKANNIL